MSGTVLRHSIVDHVRLHAESVPDRVALEVLDGEELDYRAVWHRVRALSALLAELPIPRRPDGMRLVALVLPNGVDAALAVLACQYLGITAIPVNGLLAPPEIRVILQDAGPAVVLSAAPYLEKVRDVAAGESPAPVVVDLENTALPDRPVDTPPAVDGSHPLLIAYTSGTTGLPKGAIYSNDHQLVQFMRWGWHFGLTARDTLLTCGPMFHNSYGGLSLLALMSGARNLILRSFDAGRAGAELADRASFAFLVPSMISAILDASDRAGGRNMAATRFVLSSGAPITAELLDRTIAAFPHATVAEAYGWSEGGWVTFETKDPGTLRPQCVGWPMAGVELGILDLEGAPCPVGQPGEIAVRNITSFGGYLGRAEEPRRLGREDLLLSGDVGVRDEDGRIRVVDRVKDVIVSGGENVYSAEVERALASHPAVAESAVVGCPDERWGEIVVAVVVADDPADLDAADLDAAAVRSHCRAELARYKVPKVVVFRRELPRNAMGKVQKYLLRQEVESQVRAGARAGAREEE